MKLFDDNTFFEYKFPPPQYLGAKFTHLSWISQFLPTKIKTVCDAFSGSQSVSYFFKQYGYKTITNDFLKFNHQIGLSLIENRTEILTENDISLLFSKTDKSSEFTLMDDTFRGIFFKKEDSLFIDNFRANVNMLENKYKQALALTVMNRSLTRKITMGHFAHTQALNYANNPDRIKRNRSLIKPIKELFLEILPLYNTAIFDNKQDNMSYNENILELLPNLNDVDMIYFDPPYCDSHADYQSFYHLLETYTEYWKDKKFVNGIKRYEPQKYSGFDKKTQIIKSFEQMFLLSEHIPYWLISYNNRSFPDIVTFEAMLKKYKNVRTEIKEYKNGRGGKGSVAGSNEVLFICSPKHFI